jgi:broad specificity polyphosphatase/5'/3'-nucleotidase SurE
MNMTKLKSELRELTIEELDTVAGGMNFFGMNCSVNQNNAIGAVVALFEGTILEGAAIAAGQALCS